MRISFSLPGPNARAIGLVFGCLLALASGSGAARTLSQSPTRPAIAAVGPAAQTDITLLAGALGGVGNVDGVGSGARFDQPCNVAADSTGTLYVADSVNSTIRKIAPDGTVTTLAGLADNSGDVDGVGSAARFNQPCGVAVDGTGTVYVADTYNDAIRKITPDGTVTTLVGPATGAGLSYPHGVAVDSTGTVYVADTANSVIRKLTPDGQLTTIAEAARFDWPRSIAVDSAGTLYVADTQNFCIRKITQKGIVTTLAGLAGQPGSVDGAGSTARFNYPSGITVDARGRVFVADTGNSTLRKIMPDGTVTTLAGLAGKTGHADGKGANARFYGPAGVVVDGADQLYVADTGNGTIRRISQAAVVTTFAGNAAQHGAMDGSGSAARFNNPSGIAVDGTGTMYVADSVNSIIRKITPDGTVTTLAGAAGQFGWVDGNGAAARFYEPTGIAVDAAGTLYVADFNNSNIRKITPDGTVTTLAGNGLRGFVDGNGGAAQFNLPKGVAVDRAGNVYVADTYNCSIRKITPDGTVTTLAGDGYYGSTNGQGSAARFNQPSGIAVDASGIVYVGDTDNFEIRRITPDGTVTTLAGRAGQRGSVDGSGSAARFRFPSSVAIDSAGNLYVADTGNSTLRMITPGGAVSTVAGAALVRGVILGVGGSLNTPAGAAIDSSGKAYVTSEDSILKLTFGTTPGP